MKTFKQFVNESLKAFHILYHGTSKESADKLLKHGWHPNKYFRGSQQGNPSHFYLTNHPENAKWYADEKDSGVILRVKVHKDHLKVDPEDGVADSVDQELNHSKLPGNVIATKHIPAHHFEIHKL